MNQSLEAKTVFDTISAIKAGKKEPQEALPPALSSLRLGRLLHILQRYLQATRCHVNEKSPSLAPLEKLKKCTIICCADHGVAKMRLSAYPPETTAQMTANYLLSKGASANALADFAKSDLFVVDLGIKEPLPPLPDLIDRKIARGTKNSAKGPAMTRKEAIRSLAIGIDLAKDLIAKGYRCFLPGEMGIANTTTSAAITACLCQQTPEQATGRGTNISEKRLQKKIEVVRQILKINHPDPHDGIDVLQKVGGFEFGCIAGIILGAALKRALVILDGVNTGAAALIAQALAPASKDVLLPSHISLEPAHAAILKKLALTPYMDMRFRLGEAIGSSIIADFLDATLNACQYTSDSIAATKEPALKNTQRVLKATNIVQNTSDADAVIDAFDDAAAICLPTFPKPDTFAMSCCQKRLNSLLKPIYSLGKLEELSVHLAGITHDPRPTLKTKRALLVFTTKKLSEPQKQLTTAFSAHTNAPVTFVQLALDSTAAAAFTYGQKIALEMVKDCAILGISLAAPTEKAAQKKAASLKKILCSPKDATPSLDTLRQLSPTLQIEAAALLGAFCAAGTNRTLIVLDDPAGESIARYAKRLSPTISPYLLYLQRDIFPLFLAASCGIAATLGIRLIDAALYVLNDMKTFAQTAVAAADDGPGRGQQG